MFVLAFTTDSAAFKEYDYGEICRVLEEASRTVREVPEGKLRDKNGNTIGFWRYDPE